VNIALWPGWWRTTLLRVVVFLAPVLALLATGPAGSWPSGALVALTVALAGGFAAMPESGLGTAVFSVLGAGWGFFLGGVPARAMVAAAGLLAAHLSALLLSYGPAQLPLDNHLLARWVRRGLLVGSVVPAIWLLAAAVEDQPEPPGIWVAALVAAIALCVVATGAVKDRDPA